MVAHHEVVETWLVRSKAIQLLPGSSSALWRLPTPYASTPAAMTSSARAVVLKNFDTLSWMALR